jgi:hypothetical protein
MAVHWKGEGKPVPVAEYRSFAEWLHSERYFELRLLNFQNDARKRKRMVNKDRFYDPSQNGCTC